jgi:hypothetical protein
MDTDKSIFEKFTDKVKDIANIAADAANDALKPEEPPRKVRKMDDKSAAYIPLAADGLVSDPLMVPPIAVVPAPRKQRGALKRTAKRAGTKTAVKKAAGKSAGKTAKKSASRRSKTAAKTTARKANKKTTKKARKRA